MIEPRQKMPRSGSTPFSVWPYFLLSGLSGLAALVFVVIGWSADYPTKSELVKVSGKIATIVVKDDLSNTGAGAILPALTSVYFTLEGVQGEFRYPYTHPKYPLVRDNTAGSLDIWVDGSEIGVNLTMKIWQLQEHSNLNYLVPETSITYEEVIVRLTRSDRSMVELGLWLFAVSGILALVGIGARLWNRRRSPGMAA